MKRTRKPIAIKVATASPAGVSIINKQPSTYSRTMHAIKQLGMDAERYAHQASIRMYSRMAGHQYLGMNIVNN